MGSCRHHGTFLLGAVFAGSKSTDSFDLVVEHLASQCLAILVSAPVCSPACVWRSLQAGVWGGQTPRVSALRHISSCRLSFWFCL